MADMDIDRSCLPPVQEVCRDFAVLEDGALAYCLQEQEIEQHYASNVQKHQLFQRDVRIAKKLQRLEKQASKRPVPEPQQQHGQDTGSAPEGVRRKAEEGRQRKDHDQQAIAAKQLQDLEEHRKGERHRQKQRLKSWQGTRGDDTEPLSWAMAELELQGQQQQQQQLQQDEALAWKLHVEEQTQLRARKTQQRGDDYRAAQVAQDEEIARYIQDQELTVPRRSPSEDVGAQGFTEAHSSLSELRRSRGQEKEAQQSCTAASPVSVQSLESSKAPRGGGGAAAITSVLLPQPCRNIAEDLDPTFKAKRMEPPAAEAPTCSRAAVPVQPVPVDGFFDYLDEVAESTFVPPTKRQPEKLGRHKSGDRKEGCKQQ